MCLTYCIRSRRELVTYSLETLELRARVLKTRFRIHGAITVRVTCNGLHTSKTPMLLSSPLHALISVSTGHLANLAFEKSNLYHLNPYIQDAYCARFHLATSVPPVFYFRRLLSYTMADLENDSSPTGYCRPCRAQIFDCFAKEYCRKGHMNSSQE